MDYAFVPLTEMCISGQLCNICVILHISLYNQQYVIQISFTMHRKCQNSCRNFSGRQQMMSIKNGNFCVFFGMSQNVHTQNKSQSQKVLDYMTQWPLVSTKVPSTNQLDAKFPFQTAQYQFQLKMSLHILQIQPEAF